VTRAPPRRGRDASRLQQLGDVSCCAGAAVRLHVAVGDVASISSAIAEAICSHGELSKFMQRPAQTDRARLTRTPGGVTAPAVEMSPTPPAALERGSYRRVVNAIPGLPSWENWDP
jgi:hypothetical protein